MRSFIQRLVRSWWPVFLFLLFPTSAQAHSDLRLGPFAGGILHPLETPAHLLLLISLGLFLGQHPLLSLKSPLVIFGFTTAVALLLAAVINLSGIPQVPLFCLSLGLGALISSGFKPPGWIYLLLLVLPAVGIGLDSGFGSLPMIVACEVLFATWVCLLVMVGYIAFYVSLLPARQWSRIGVRILGSWIVAISVLILAFFLKNGKI